MRSKILQLLLVPVLAGAMLLTSSATAHAAPSAEAASRAAIEAKAIETAEAVEKSLRATGSATFTSVNGTVHRMSVSSDRLVLDGRSFSLADAGIQADVWCNIRVGAAIAAITVVGALAIWVFIAGLPVTVPVAIAGLTFTAGTWSTIASILAAGGSLVPIMQTLLC